MEKTDGVRVYQHQQVVPPVTEPPRVRLPETVAPCYPSSMLSQLRGPAC